TVEFHRNRCDVVQVGVDRIGDWVSRNQLKESQKLRRLGARGVEYVLQEKDRIAVVKRTLASWIDELNARRKELARAEAAEVVGRGTNWRAGDRQVLARDLSEMGSYRDIRCSKYVQRILGRC